MDIASGIAAASQALGIAKGLRSIEKSYDAATLKIQLADLATALSDVKLALVEAREELANKDQTIDRLLANFAVRGELVQADGDYRYFVGDNGEPKGFPVCPKCEIAGEYVQLKQNGGITQTRCPSCAGEFQPVTCYLGLGEPDATLQARSNRLKAERHAQTNAAIARINGRGGWAA